jgi:hypothetical protein
VTVCANVQSRLSPVESKETHLKLTLVVHGDFRESNDTLHRSELHGSLITLPVLILHNDQYTECPLDKQILLLHKHNITEINGLKM